MSSIEQAIQDVAYGEIFLVCKVADCLKLFEPSLNEPATDPVDKWAEDIARRAFNAGWSVDASGRVLCPEHRPT
jgi:hypothetical protein